MSSPSLVSRFPSSPPRPPQTLPAELAQCSSLEYLDVSLNELEVSGVT